MKTCHNFREWRASQITQNKIDQRVSYIDIKKWNEYPTKNQIFIGIYYALDNQDVTRINISNKNIIKAFYKEKKQ